jgi:hypothetical protein
MLLASDFDKSKYLRAADLDGEKKFRIREVTSDVLTDKKGNKADRLIVWFTNDNRGLVLNKTNLRTLKGAFGDNTADWAKKIIVMFSTMASNGEMGLRVRIQPPKKSGNGAAAVAAPPPAAGSGAAVTAPLAAAPVTDPDLEPDPKVSAAGEMDDEIPF